MVSLKVRDVMIPIERRWNTKLIYGLVPLEDAARVMRVPLTQCAQHDKIIWVFNNDGHYSVKYGYRVYYRRVASRDNLNVQGRWNSIWKLEVPPRVKVLLWKACRGCLPIRTSLKRNGVQCSAICVTCSSDLDTG